MSQSLTDEAPIFVNQLPGRDWDDVAAEGQEPAGEGIGAAYPVAPVLGVTGNFFTQPKRSRRGAGGGTEVDYGFDRVTGTQLPGLAGSGVIPEIEASGNLVVVGL